MTAIRNLPLRWWLSAGVLSIALGWGAAANRQVTFVALVALLGATALAAPASAWVGAALIAALTFKGLVSLSVLPSSATFVDLPLAWGALFVGLLKHRERSPFLTRHLRWLALLAFATMLAWAFNRSEVLRPILYLVLIGEPFAIVGALMADPPSPRMRVVLERTLLVLVLVQIPLAAFQFAKFPTPDYVQGTLWRAGAGAHVISAVSVVGAIWILAGGARGALGAWRYPVVGALFVIPFIADAKQVIVALPAILLASGWRVGRVQFVVRGALVAAAVVALFTLTPARDAAARYVRENGQGHGGKQATALFLWHTLDGDPASLAFGKGPAETVSRAAFMTLPGYANSGAAFKVLGLRPAVIPLEAQSVATEVNHGNTTNSSESSVSSFLGVFGDLGLFGAFAYAGLLLSLFFRLRRETSPEGVAAACGFALFMVLGVVFDWWEQPPFGVFLGVLAGLSLSQAGRNEAVS